MPLKESTLSLSSKLSLWVNMLTVCLLSDTFPLVRGCSLLFWEMIYQVEDGGTIGILERKGGVLCVSVVLGPLFSGACFSHTAFFGLVREAWVYSESSQPVEGKCNYPLLIVAILGFCW